MIRSARTKVGVAISVASMALLAVGPSAAVGSGTAARPAHTPTLRVTIGKSHSAVRGPHAFRAGRVAIRLTGRGRIGGTAGFVRFTRGYTFKDFKADVKAANVPPPDGLVALRRAIHHSRFFGGVSADHGNTVRGTVVLPRAGRYVLYNFVGPEPIMLARLHVTGPLVRRAVPASDGTLRAKSGARWGGVKSLPHKGTLTFKNASTDSPHFLELQHVAKGTTRKQVIDCFSDDKCTFDFGRPGRLDTEVLSPGHKMTVSYDLPRGTYAQMCFFPDMKTGMPHAFMGMVRIITLTRS
jgi:hypothetical protein